MNKMSIEIATIKKIENIGETKWNHFTDLTQEKSIYSSYEWLYSLENGEKLPARHQIVTKDNTIIGALPCFISRLGNTIFKRLDSSRPGFGGPLLVHDRENTLTQLLKQTANQLSGTLIGHRILSNNPKHLKLNNILKKNGYRLRIDNICVIYSLEEPWTEIYQRMKKNRRYEMKKANIEEVRDLEHTEENLVQFIQLNHRIHKRHNAKLLQDSFYRMLVTQFGDRAKIFGAYAEEEMIGGYLVLEDHQRSTLRVLLGGIPEIKKFSNHNNNLFAKMFQYGKDNDFKYLEVGSAPSDIRDGLYRFKESLGGMDYPVYCWEKGNIIHSTLKQGSRFLNRR